MIECSLTMDMSIHKSGEDGSMTEVNRVLAFVAREARTKAVRAKQLHSPLRCRYDVVASAVQAGCL